MKTSEAIALAWDRCHVPNGRETFMCNAVASLVEDELIGPREAIGARIAIRKDIEDCVSWVSYYNWQNQTSYDCLAPELLPKKKQWVDSLVAKLQAQGD